MGKRTNIGSRLHSVERGNVVAGANEILDDAKGKKQNVINNDVDAELVRLDQSKQDNLTFDNQPTEESDNPVKSGGVYAADKALSDAIEAILILIPSAATALNQLADKLFVNSSISTSTASFKGTYNLISDLHLSVDATHAQIEAALDNLSLDADNNDYAFVMVPVSDDEATEIRRTERYKFNGEGWVYEYTLNTSGFTAAQWSAINSGITTALVAKLDDLPTNEVLQQALSDITQGLSDINELIPSEATAQNQLADKAYVLDMIISNISAFKGQFTTFAQLQNVADPKYGDLGIVRTKDSAGHDVFTFYQYKNNQWNEYYVMSYHPQDKPATTGWLGDYPYNGMGRIELPMNMVDGWPDNTWIYLPKNDVVYLLYSWHLQLYAVYNIATQEGLGLDDNIVVKPENYDIDDLNEIVDGHYLPFTEDGGVWTIEKPDESTITSTELNNTNIYNFNDPTHHGVNLLVQSMINQANTIYVIQYDFTLGEDITVPANCVLEFDGGSVKNGNITLQNTSFVKTKKKIFDNVILNGTTKDEFYITNFGCVEGVNNESINNPALLNAFTSLDNIGSNQNRGKSARLIVPSGNYYFSTPLSSDGNFDFICDGLLLYSGETVSTALTLGKSGVSIKREYKIRIEQTSTKAKINGVVPKNIGVKILNLNDSIITIDQVGYFCYGVVLEADNAGFAYNTIFLNSFGYGYYTALLLTASEENGGFINQNLFLGGKTHTFSNDIYKNENIAIHLKAVDNNINYNTFIGTCPEGAHLGIKMEWAIGNYFIRLRNEGVAILYEADDRCMNNTFIGYIDNVNFDANINTNVNLRDTALTCVAKNKAKVYTDGGSYGHIKAVSDICITNIFASGEDSKYNQQINFRTIADSTFGYLVDTTECKTFLLKRKTRGKVQIRLIDSNGQEISMADEDSPFNYLRSYTKFWGRLSASYPYIIRTSDNVYEWLWTIINPDVKKIFIGAEGETDIELYAAKNVVVKPTIIDKNVVDFIPTWGHNLEIGDSVYYRTGKKPIFVDTFDSTTGAVTWVDATGASV